MDKIMKKKVVKKMVLTEKELVKISGGSMQLLGSLKDEFKWLLGKKSRRH